MNIGDFLNLVFPRFCLKCKVEGAYICRACKMELKLSATQSCPRCHAISSDGKFCSSACNKGFYFDQLIVCMDYKTNPLLRRLISNYKYNFLKELNIELSLMMNQQLQKFVDLRDDLLITPVPLHKKRFRYRGFNQSLLLANGLKSGFLVDCLERTKYRPEQAKLQRKGRLENLKGTIAAKGELSGKHFILVDDVATTCSTINECSRALKAAGAQNVCGLVLARVW